MGRRGSHSPGLEQLGAQQDEGFHKIRMTCQLAASKCILYAWIDTCCIDKSNSTELSEAINSMYRWYETAHVCFAYLSDFRLPASNVPQDAMLLGTYLRECRWFYRGWTLQELIAPSSILFYQKDWEFVGSKKDWNDALTRVTRISPKAIYDYYPGEYSIAERMSWASNRETTREEDKAYCLLGIFNVNMPMLYGEGAKAFRRLQEVIIQTGYDVSIFSWTRYYYNPEENKQPVPAFGAFADAPGNFHSIPESLIVHDGNEVSVTNAGVKLTLELFVLPGSTDDESSDYVLPLCIGGVVFTVKDEFGFEKLPALGVKLRMISPGRFVRPTFQNLVKLPGDGEADVVRRVRYPDAYILIDPTYKTVCNLKNNVKHKTSFSLPSGCTVVKAWPSGSWNYTQNEFMTVAGESIFGSILLQVQSPTLADDGLAGQCWTGEFMFLFSELPDKLLPNTQYTIVGYREHQLVLDTINLSLAAGDMDTVEMRRTLRNFAIPTQRTAAVPVEEKQKYIYTSVDIHFENRYTFESWSVAFENEQELWSTKIW
ncbi:het domain-containing protein [Colletotrichum chrysophilum]|uniref:Het domain-containing protein n=1 Tax=Colletotrichum chrysophilum TaxID=1836956 RepID=A0AAD9AEK8_9PEZI|nr:het domain-containing protein [Colletotrichum chrysophilum]